MDNSTISMTIFSSFFYVYQRVEVNNSRSGLGHVDPIAAIAASDLPRVEDGVSMLQSPFTEPMNLGDLSSKCPRNEEISADFEKGKTYVMDILFSLCWFQS